VTVLARSHGWTCNRDKQAWFSGSRHSLSRKEGDNISGKATARLLHRRLPVGAPAVPPVEN